MAAEPERIPRATYRIQFRGDFGFARARDLIGYLARLGISDLYASPLFQARRESTHGYDVVDPRRLDPRFGPEADFESLGTALERAGMGLILDIVPNHMAAVPANPWFRDVLEKGPRSPFASFFDIDWSQHQTLVPVLGEPLEDAVAKGHLTLELSDRGLSVRYCDKLFPLDPASYPEVLRAGLQESAQDDGEDPARRELARLLDRMAQLPPATEPADPDATSPGARREAFKRKLLELYRSRETLRDMIDESIQELNDTLEDPTRLMALLEQQAYRLAFWREAARSLNYRRFFNINDLIGIRVEDPDVFEATHARVLSLFAQGRLSGLRVDHIDGLHDPEAYLQRLQMRLAASAGRPGPFYVVVEKILRAGESLPHSWAVAGTTGYDFVGDVAGLFLDGDGLERLRRAYAGWTGDAQSVADVAYRQKLRILETTLAPETRALAAELQRLAAESPALFQQSPPLLERALLEVTACLPVYRSYIRDSTLSPEDRRWIDEALAQARRRSPQLSAAIDALGRGLKLEAGGGSSEAPPKSWLDFVQRWQQLTGPAMAKGVEDTAFYIYNALAGANEVGGEFTSVSVPEFHRRQQRRRRDWPHTLNASSTHDTKRSEDARARIDALSQMAPEWIAHFESWARANARWKSSVGGQPVPDTSEEVLLYQSLLGVWPLEEHEMPELPARFESFLVKALREAKVHTRWSEPNRVYEEAVRDFFRRILDRDANPEFLEDFRSFQERVARAGALASLSQTLLKIAAPGVPDFYQGTELWDFSMVDPDNRRPVDFGKRDRLLAQIDEREAQDREELLRSLRRQWRDGAIKLFLTSRALKARAAHAELFARGDYVPLEVSPEPRAFVAFARRLESEWAIAVCPRSVGLDSPADPFRLAMSENARVLLPAGAPRLWKDLLTDRRFDASDPGDPTLAVDAVLEAFPVSLLVGAAEPR